MAGFEEPEPLILDATTTNAESVIFHDKFLGSQFSIPFHCKLLGPNDKFTGGSLILILT